MEDSNAIKNICRYCRQPVVQNSIKCHHCGEFLTTRTRIEKILKRLVTFIGVATALLSLFYGMKEGYFFIEERQQKREALAAYMDAAENFENMDNPGYAEAVLEKALSIYPYDTQLKLRLFYNRAHGLLREADYYGIQLPDSYLEIIPELITTGFGLTSGNLESSELAKVYVNIGRLLRYDRSWQNTDEISSIFAKAYQSEPENPEAAFWYGEWLLANDEQDAKGLELINKAIQIHSNNSLYWATLGRYQDKRGNYPDAFSSIKKAIELKPDQSDLQQIRASNEAKRELKIAILNADEVVDIRSDVFYGMSKKERSDLIDYAVTNGSEFHRFQVLIDKFYNLPVE